MPFFVARMPEGQSRWPTIRAVRAHLGAPSKRWSATAPAAFMIFPTIRTLERPAQLRGHRCRVRRPASEQPLWQAARAPAARWQGSPPHGGRGPSASWKWSARRPDPTLDWQSERAVPLRKNLLRLTAPNPGVMTGPGTNSYLVGDAATGYIAIDPARPMPSICSACRCGRRRHPPHRLHPFPPRPLAGRRPLQAWPAGRHASPPIMGLPSAPTARPASRFTPDHATDGERITLQEAQGEITHTLQAVFTPGHAANHLCFVLEEDACCSAATTSSTAAPPSSTRRTAT
jgi:hypothetical protein